MSSIATTLGVVIVRSAGFTQGLELSAYDWLIRSRPYETWDDRVQVVGITKDDLEKGWGSEHIPNKELEQLLAKVQEANPRVIGLDIFRDQDYPRPQDKEKYDILLKRFKQSNCVSQKACVVVTCWGKDHPRKGEERRANANPGTQMPRGASLEQLGFADVVTDKTTPKAVRRQLLTIEVESNTLCPAETALSYQLATRYLEKKGRYPKNVAGQDFLKIDQKIFHRLWGVDSPWDWLWNATGGYPKHDPEKGYDLRGYQIMLNYRSQSNPTPISYNDVLTGKEHTTLHDRVVLIGYTKMREKDYSDLHATPYSRNTSEDQLMAGVILQAHMTSQILSAVLDNRPLIQGWPRVVEFVWILFLALLGGMLAYWQRFTLHLLAGIVVTLFLLWFLCLVLLIRVGYWVPFVPSVLSLLFTIVSAFLYTICDFKFKKKVG